MSVATSIIADHETMALHRHLGVSTATAISLITMSDFLDHLFVLHQAVATNIGRGSTGREKDRGMRLASCTSQPD